MRIFKILILSVALVLMLGILINAASVKLVVAKGTIVDLKFDKAFSSRTSKIGDSVSLHVVNDVRSGNTVVIKKGTKVTGVMSSVDKRKRYGVNAKIRIALNPVKSTYGVMIPIEPRTKGDYIGGKTGEAAGATIGGAAILGPVGLVGGYFVVGKPVTVKVGDPLSTMVTKNIVLKK